MRHRGLTLGGVLVAMAVLLLFAAITIPIFRLVRSRSGEDFDADRMRLEYVAMSLYESANDGAPSPNLLLLRHDLGDDRLLRSDTDPWAKSSASSFPIEPELPDLLGRSPIRISDAYLVNFVRAQKLSVGSWPEVRSDPRIGILACSWDGAVQVGLEPFTATLYGPVLRINTDGSLFHLPSRDGAMGDGQSLFLKR